jgi:uncharacterized protein YbjT (DUF2867 family)
MNVFLAGASGVIGVRLIPLLVAAGHQVTGMTRPPSKAVAVRALGADPLVCDVFETATLCAAVMDARPDVIMSQITDLPDDVTSIGEFGAANARIRREGTQTMRRGARSRPSTRRRRY